MPFRSFPVLSAKTRKPTRIGVIAVFCGLVAGIWTLGGVAQSTQGPSGPPKPIIAPAANPMHDANDQMMMREKNSVQRNFDAANAERLKQLEEAAQIMETMAIALKAEVDKSVGTSQNEIHKAETIEKLAHMVKERMKLTVAPN